MEIRTIECVRICAILFKVLRPKMKKIIATALIMAAPLSSQAQASDWEYSLTPYLWLPTISVDSSDYDGSGNNMDVGPTNYLEALDFGFMIAGEARKDKIITG